MTDMNFMTIGETVYHPLFGQGKVTNFTADKVTFQFGQERKVFLRSAPFLMQVSHQEFNQPVAESLVPYVRIISITCQPSKVPQTIEWFSENSSLSPSEALDYILPTTEASHHAKFDIEVVKDTPEEIINKLGVPLDSRSLASWLIKEHGLLPVKRIQ